MKSNYAVHCSMRGPKLSPGWRHLTTAEIHAAAGRSREFWPVSTIEQWCPVARKWLNPSCGDIVGIHYRTKKPFGYFLTH